MARSRVVKVRVTEQEYSDWTEMALSRSVSLSETIRRAMQGNTPPESPKPLESLPVAYYDGTANTANATITYTKLNLGDGARGAVHKFGQALEDLATPPERRKEPCPHGKPGFAFCPECDT